jgi:hypothetical protein
MVRGGKIGDLHLTPSSIGGKLVISLCARQLFGARLLQLGGTLFELGTVGFQPSHPICGLFAGDFELLKQRANL